MSNKRIAKKRLPTLRPSSLRTIRRLMVEVPCPSCAHPSLERRYLPAIGGLNGTVACPACARETDAPDVVMMVRTTPMKKSTSLGVGQRAVQSLVT